MGNNAKTIADYKAEISVLQNKIKELEKQNSLDKKELKKDAENAIGKFMLAVIGKPWYVFDTQKFKSIILKSRDELNSLGKSTDIPREQLSKLIRLKNNLNIKKIATKSDNKQVINEEK